MKTNKIPPWDTVTDPNCPTCAGEGWVCEFHQNIPWRGGDQICCGGAGAPCPTCQPEYADTTSTMRIRTASIGPEPKREPHESEW